MPDPADPIPANPVRPISAQAKRLHERLVRLGDTGLLEVQITSGGLGKALNELLLCSIADIKAHPTVRDRSGAPAALVVATPSSLVIRKPGRPPLPPDQRQTARVEVRLTPAQRVKLDRLGGAQWIRERIEKARE